jgi:hypothetical protein
MNVEIKELIAEIEKTEGVLANLENVYRTREEWFSTGDRAIEKAVLLADIFVNYYTCSETLFFRISQFFENSLPTEKWHSELLRKMNLTIPDIREQVISDETFSILDDFRKFRHFKRYYFSMDYDWDRLEFLRKKFQRLIPIFTGDIASFKEFMVRLGKR